MNRLMNRNKGMDIWNRLTVVRGEGGGWDWLKEGEGISQRTYRQQCDNGQREGG